MELRFEEIYGSRLAVSGVHGFSQDSLLLADFAAPKPSDISADLCTGCGIIPAIWLARGLSDKVAALDISREAVELCRATVQANGWQEKLLPLCGDLREHPLGRERYTLVTANPPYFEIGSGRPCSDEAAAVARGEVSCTLADAAAAAAYALRYGGRFCLCHRPERLTDALTVLRGCGLEPKRLELISHAAGEKPWLMLIEAKKGGGRGLDILLTEDRENG